MKTSKEIIDLIKKKAFTPSGAPVYQGAAPVQNNVRQMQDKLQVVVNYINQYGIGNVSEEERNSRIAFNNFMINSYANNGLHGYERDQGQDSDPANITDPERNLHIVQRLLDTLNQTGGKLPETNTDGFWDYRTNNALQNIFAYTSGVSNTVKALRIPTKDVTTPLSVLAKNIIKESTQAIDHSGTATSQAKMDPTDLKNANTKAAAIIPALDEITKFLYDAFTQIFRKNHELVKTFSLNAPLYTQKANKGASTQRIVLEQSKISQNNKDIIEQTLEKDLSSPRGQQKKYQINFDPPISVKLNRQAHPILLKDIHLWNLINKDNFKTYLSQHQIPDDDKTMVLILNVMAQRKDFATSNIKVKPVPTTEKPGEASEYGRQMNSWLRKNEEL